MEVTFQNALLLSSQIEHRESQLFYLYLISAPALQDCRCHLWFVLDKAGRSIREY